MACKPVSTPAPVPAINAACLPYFRANSPAGKTHKAMPKTKIEIGNVTKSAVGANKLPTTAPLHTAQRY